MFSKVFFAVILVIAMFALISEAHYGGGGYRNRGFGRRSYGYRGGYRGGYGDVFGYRDAFYGGFGFEIGAAYVLPVVTTAIVVG